MGFFRNLFGTQGQEDGAQLPVWRKASLYENIVGSLAKTFPGHCRLEVPLDQFVADAVIEQGNTMAIVEIKTGDPNLLLPSSTPSQMKDILTEARNTLGPNVISILVTNYKVPEQLKLELEKDKVQILAVKSPLPHEGFGQAFAQLLGTSVPLASE